jgi:hypothetical protein
LTRTDMHGEFTKIEPIQSVQPVKCTAYQPCVNADETRCVFVTGYQNIWQNNDLCEIQLVKVVELTKVAVQQAIVDIVPAKPLELAVNTIPVVSENKIISDVTDARQTSDNDQATVTVVENKGKLEMNISPNPVSSQTKIEVLSPVDGHMTISIYSQTGQLVSTVYDGQSEKGIHIFTWAKNALSNGVYTVRTIVEKNVITKKIVVCGDLGPQ